MQIGFFLYVFPDPNFKSGKLREGATVLPRPYPPLQVRHWRGPSWRPLSRAVDPHSVLADPDLAVLLNSDPDPAVFFFFSNLDPA